MSSSQLPEDISASERGKKAAETRMEKDGEFRPESNSNIKKRAPKKTTVLAKVWPQIKKLAEKGTEPQDIANIVNGKLEPKDHLTGKQISNKIARMKNQGQIKLNVSKTSGSSKASSHDSDWSRMVAQYASNNESDFDNADEEEDSEDEDIIHGSSYLRFRSHSTRAHFFIVAEACVSRQWSAKVSDEDDTVIELTVVMKVPDYNLIDKLFPHLRVDFGFEDEEEETFTFHLNAGNKVARKNPSTSFSPNEETPIWYSFLFDFADALREKNAKNVDFTDKLIKGFNNNNNNNENNKRDRENDAEQNSVKKKANTEGTGH
jgi:hypothetical protein